VSAPFVFVRVIGSALSLTQLQVAVHFDTSNYPNDTSPEKFGVPASAQTPFNLPKTFTVELPDGYTGDCSVDVDGTDASGAVVASGSAYLLVKANGEQNLTVTLGGGAPDLGASGTLSCPANAIICEGFETMGGLPSGWIASVEHLGTVGVDTMHPHTGTGALHVQTSVDADAGVGFSSATGQYDISPPIASGSLAARAWLYFDAVANPEVIGWGSAPTQPDLVVDGWVGGGSTWGVSLNYLSRSFASLIFPRPNHWTCLELLVDIGPAPPADGGSSGRLRLLVDGQSAVDQPFDTATAVGGGLNYFAVGLDNHHANANMWVDDVVVAPQSSPIGCN
jgi:hypothetical protein